MALQDLRGRALQMLVEIVQELPRAPRPVLRLGLPVVPGDAARLPFDVRPGHVGGHTTEEPLDRAEPAQVEIDERAPLLAGCAGEVAVLGAQVHGKAPEPLLEVAPPTSADDVDVGAGQLRERSEERADLGGRLCEVGMHLELAERSVVVEDDRASARAREPAAEPLLDRGVDGRRALAWPDPGGSSDRGG